LLKRLDNRRFIVELDGIGHWGFESYEKLRKEFYASCALSAKDATGKPPPFIEIIKFH
jgi:hypothetical protein